MRERQMILRYRHPSVLPRTARLLRKAVRLIRRHEERFNMGRWVRSDAGDGEMVADIAKYGGECGAMFCLGGWLLLLTPPEYRKRHRGRTIGEVARQWAGLSYGQGQKLFHLTGWPVNHGSLAYLDAKTDKARVDALDMRVEHFIETGE